MPRSAKLALTLVLGLAAEPGFAQQPVNVPPAGVGAACGPGNTSPGCLELRRGEQRRGEPATAIRPGRQPAPLVTVIPPPPRGDVRAERFIPPHVIAFLNDRRVEPTLRAFLLGMAGRKRETWTVAELQQVTAVVPSLTEMYIPTATLSAFYEFMGLDPASLFDPQLGSEWQTSTVSEFDPRNRFRRSRCTTLSRVSRVDPTAVLVQDLLSCQDER